MWSGLVRPRRSASPDPISLLALELQLELLQTRIDQRAGVEVERRQGSSRQAQLLHGGTPGAGGDPVAWTAHIGGFVYGLAVIRLFMPRPPS